MTKVITLKPMQIKCNYLKAVNFEDVKVVRGAKREIDKQS